MLTVRSSWLDLRPGQLLLDIGTGLGRHSQEGLRWGARVVALDLAPDDLLELRSRLAATAAEESWGEGPPPWAVVQADATGLPVPDGACDRVVVAEVLEHVADDAAALAEVARVLRPGGVVAVTVPSWLPERICWALDEGYHAPAVPGGHVRIYRRHQVVALLEQVGLEPGPWHRAHALHAPYWWLRCTLGAHRDDRRAVRWYRWVLERQILRPSRLVAAVERALDPVLGKSLVVYARKP